MHRIARSTFLLLALPACAAAAQTMSPCTSESNTFLTGSPVAYISQNTPLAYTANIRTTWEEKLADGNRTLKTSDSLEARNTHRRLVRIEPLGCDTSSDGQPQIKVRTSTYDPVAHTRMLWDTGPGTLKLITLASAGFPVLNANGIQRNEQPLITHHSEIRQEDLGPRTIAGIPTTGKRTVRIIPSGSEGNDAPIQIIRDEWTVPSSHLLLMVSDTDPRHGTASWEVTSFTFAEPDPKLFATPTGYAVRNITSRTTVPHAAP